MSSRTFPFYTESRKTKRGKGVSFHCMSAVMGSGFEHKADSKKCEPLAYEITGRFRINPVSPVNLTGPGKSLGEEPAANGNLRALIS